MVDYTKFDFSKFDVTKMFDAAVVVDTVEKNNKTLTGLITDNRVRTAAEGINSAGCDLVRAQISAAKTFGAAIKKALAV